MINNLKKLDKYYTKKEIAEKCYLYLKQFFNNNVLFLEPSAGSGVFLKCIKEEKIGFDIEPTDEEKIIIKNNFLNKNVLDFF